MGDGNLKVFSRAIDRFCQKHRRFGIPRLMLYLVIISAIVFILSSEDMIDFLRFKPGNIMSGQVWRLITWIFIPISNNIFFAAIVLYFYYFVGSTLEREWGAGKFTIYYIFGVLLYITYGFVMWFTFRISTEYLSPYYLNLSMLFAFATLFPEVTIRFLLIIPLKIKWLGLINAVYFLYLITQGIIAQRVDLALLPVPAILNYFLICGNDLMAHLRPLKARTSPQVINFKKASKQAKRDLADKPYRHKCAVCGKTDTEYPNLEFRYCSKCEGYHCFCIDHINNHIHFDE
jgi:hypothetical protein